MILALILLAAGIAVILVLVTFVQMLYLESMRLRTRELPALQFFKEELEDRIGQHSDIGSLTYSLIKHSLLVLLGSLIFAITSHAGGQLASAFLEAALFGLAAMVLSTYIVPQVLYRRTQGRWVVAALPLLKLLALLARPAIAILSFLQSLFELGEPVKTDAENAASSAETIEALISAGTEEGILEEDDRKLIQSVVAFGDKTVREVMTPRPNVVAIGADKTLEELRQLVIHEQYSRIPIYEESIDDVIGFMHVRDMFELDKLERAAKTAKDILRPIKFVPETKPVNDLLREMQQDRAHMVVVVDEYGNTAGLATMEDLVEEILGEIRDEHEPARDVQQEGEGVYVVSGSFDLDHLHDLFEFRVEAATESTTVGGLVTEWAGHVPQVGEIVEKDGLRLEVLAGNELRVEQVRISKVPETNNVENTKVS